MTSLKQKGSRFTAGKFTRRGLLGAAAASSTLLMNRRFAFGEKATDKFKGQTLNVLTWPGHGEPYMVALFEERYESASASRNMSVEISFSPSSIRRRREPMTSSWPMPKSSSSWLRRNRSSG